MTAVTYLTLEIDYEKASQEGRGEESKSSVESIVYSILYTVYYTSYIILEVIIT